VHWAYQNCEAGLDKSLTFKQSAWTFRKGIADCRDYVTRFV